MKKTEVNIKTVDVSAQKQEKHWQPKNIPNYDVKRTKRNLGNSGEHPNDMDTCDKRKTAQIKGDDEKGAGRKRRSAPETPVEHSIDSKKPVKDAVSSGQADRHPKKARTNDNAKAEPPVRKQSGGKRTAKQAEGVGIDGKKPAVNGASDGAKRKTSPKPVKRRKDTRADSEKVMPPVRFQGEPVPVKDTFDLVEIMLDGKPVQVAATSIRDGYYCQGLDSTFIVRHLTPPKGRPKSEHIPPWKKK